MKITAIVAMDRNRVIGNSKTNNIPWKLSTDFKHFKANTLGKVLIMGRKTYESIGKPLPGRFTIVVSSTMDDIESDNAMVCRSVKGALYALGKVGDLRKVGLNKEIMICGGANIYKQTMHLWTDLIVTKLDAEFEGDVKCPDYEDQFYNFETLGYFKKGPKDECDFDIYHLKPKSSRVSHIKRVTQSV